MTMIKAYLVLILSGLIVFSGCASNKDIDSLERRLSRLENKLTIQQDKIQQLKTDIASQSEVEKSLRDLYAGQGAEFYKFKEGVSRLHGRFDETEYKMNQNFQSLNSALENTGDAVDHFSKMTKKNDTRLKHLEQFMGIEPGGKAGAADQKTASDIDKLNEEAHYQAAKSVFDRGNSSAARDGFEEFLKKYPKSKEADNARFWIGETYFSEGAYKKAILEYQKVIDEYPNGNKIRSAYLKMGIAFQQLGENSIAVQSLNELINKYPKSNEAEIARQKVSQIE